MADQVYDSEFQQALRACLPVLTQHFGEQVMIAGWLSGERVTFDVPDAFWTSDRTFELTGSPCPRCGINPEAYGVGGGVRCVNARDCGYWFCA